MSIARKIVAVNMLPITPSQLGVLLSVSIVGEMSSINDGNEKEVVLGDYTNTHSPRAARHASVLNGYQRRDAESYCLPLLVSREALQADPSLQPARVMIERIGVRLDGCAAVHTTSESLDRR